MYVMRDGICTYLVNVTSHQYYLSLIQVTALEVMKEILQQKHKIKVAMTLCTIRQLKRKT